MRNFNAKEKLQQATLAFIVHSLDTNDEIMKLKKIFQYINKNHDGKITPNDLREGLLRIKGHILTENEIVNIFKKIDQDHNGYIDYEEFLRASLDYTKIINQTNLKIAFNNFDINKDGLLDREELMYIFKADNIEYFDELIKKIDLNKDGKIDFKEFSDLMNDVLIEIISHKSSVKSMLESSLIKNVSIRSKFSKDAFQDKDQ